MENKSALFAKFNLTREEFLGRQKKEREFPYIWEYQGSSPDEFYALYLRASSQMPHSFFLDGAGCSHSGFSYFNLQPPRQLWQAESLAEFSALWPKLKRQLRRRMRRSKQLEKLPFTGGWVGVLSYEAGRAFEPAWRGLRNKKDPLQFPVLNMGEYDSLCALDHKKQKIFLSLWVRRSERYETFLARIRKMEQQLQQVTQAVNPQFSLSKLKALSENKNSYLRKVKKIQRYIASGDIYQANLSHRFQSRYRGSAAALYRVLRENHPVPYSAFLRLAQWQLLSLSPELLVQKRGKMIATRPIAGTRRRGKNQREDAALEGEMLLSPKERAEHVMLLDLERNDLGRVAKAGTVSVRERMVVERYAHVMHIVSLVAGQVQADKDIFSVLEALFPGGTITGCPKVRCLEILDALEPFPRGPFYGSLGWIDFCGDGEWNLLIRSAVVRAQKLWIQVGAGIVADSVPSKEYQETLDKAAHFTALTG